MSLGPVTPKTIETAIKGSTVEARALATQAIGRMLRDHPMTESERRLSAQIFDILSKDVTEEVRRALAITLRLSKNLPREIAHRLAHDVDTIAVPILSSSPVITDEDLLEVLESRAGVKAQAVASRKHLSRKVSHAVIEFGDAASIASLAANDTALIAPEDAARMVELAKDDDLIRAAALRRQDMPQDLVVKLIQHHVGHIDQCLQPETEHHAQIARDTGERAHARWTSADWAPDAMKTYVASLAAAGSLSDAVIARAAGQGDWRFVQLAIASRANISATKVGLMILDSGTFALKMLLERSGLQEGARELISVSSEAFRDLERSGRSLSRAQFQRLMAERVASHPVADHYADLWMDWLDEGLGPRSV